MSGSISVLGANAASLHIPALRRQFAVVPQAPVLFSGSVRDNLDTVGGCSNQELAVVLQVRLRAGVIGLVAARLVGGAPRSGWVVLEQAGKDSGYLRRLVTIDRLTTSSAPQTAPDGQTPTPDTRNRRSRCGSPSAAWRCTGATSAAAATSPPAGPAA